MYLKTLPNQKIMAPENIIIKRFLARLRNKIIPCFLSLGILAGAELLFYKKANSQDDYGKLTFQQVLKSILD